MQETPALAHTDLLYRSHEEIRSLQNQRFRHQIALCFRAHPYYQEVFRRLKLTPDDFQTVEDVQKDTDRYDCLHILKVSIAIKFALFRFLGTSSRVSPSPIWKICRIRQSFSTILLPSCVESGL